MANSAITNILIGGPRGLVPIASVTASSDATVDFDNVFDGSYDAYLITFSAVVPATDGARLWGRIGTGATPTYQSGASAYAWCSNYTTAGSSTGSYDAADSQIEIINVSGAIGSASGEAGGGEIYLHAPSNTGAYTYQDHRYFGLTNSANPYSNSGGGVYLATTAVTSYRFLMSSGNVASGEFHVYGLETI